MSPPYTAQLRVYEPIEAFSPDQAELWRKYVNCGRALSRQDGPVRERALMVAAVRGDQPRLALRTQPEAYVEYVDGEPRICPWNVRARLWEAVGHTRDLLPAPLVDWLVTPETAAQARRLLRRACQQPDRRAIHIRTHRWGVPVRWFALFGAAERSLSLGVPATSGHCGTDRPVRELRYITEIGRARRRAGRALRILRDTIGSHPTVGGMEDLAQWLEGFHADSLVELDYGRLVHLVDDEQLRADESAREFAEVLTGLESGAGAAALSGYDRVTSRWDVVRRLESLN